MIRAREQRLWRAGGILFTLVISAWLCARGATQLLAASLLPVTHEGSAPSAMRRRASRVTSEHAPSPRELAMAVLERNMFDSQTGAIAWDAPYVAPVGDPKPEPAGPVADPIGEPAACEGGLRLVASLVVPRLPELSRVSIEADGKSSLYRSGMQVDGHDIVGIREHRVFMRPSGRPLCQLTMFRPPAVPGQPAAPPADGPSAPSVYKNADPDDPWTPGNNVVQGGVSEDELAQGITRVSDTEYTVARALIDKALSNQSELLRGARMVPYEENGRVIGVKVSGVRRRGLFGALGVQNGDVIRTLNGLDLSTADGALGVYAKLRSMDRLTIAMNRGGQPTSLNYSFR